MANFYGKVHLFLGAGKWGWDEEWYYFGNNGSLATLRGDAKRLVSRRRQILARQFAVEAARMTVTDETGASFRASASAIGYDTVAGGEGGLTADCINPWLAFLSRASTADGLYARNEYLRGLPAEYLCMDKDTAVPFLIPNAMRGSLQTWHDFLVGVGGGEPINGEWRMRVKDVVNGVQKAVAIDTVTVDENTGRFVITTATPIQVFRPVDPHGPNPVLRDAKLGDLIHVYGPRAAWARGLSGDHYVVNPFLVGGTTYTLSGRQKRRCVVDYIGNAIACGVNYILVKPALIDPSRPVKKSTGGPFFGTRGRRSKVEC